ncbi:MAG: DUF3298 domain-containing protein [Bacteroidales bacterium]|jgi:hypothetical protein|nr:DUF3298 domain-containing protein [Bacteroidales bacterium]
MKRLIAPLAVSALILASCQTNLKIATYTDDFVLPLSELRAQDSLSVNISAEYPIGKDNVSDLIRRGITDFLFGYGWETDDCVDSIAVYYRNALVDEYLAEYLPSVADTSDQRIMSWGFETDGHFLPDWGSYHRYENVFYEYRGGAHGQSGCVYFVFSKKTGELVEEQEFFKEGYEEPVSALIRQHLLSDYIPQLKADGFDVDELEQGFAEPTGAWVNGVYLPGPKGVQWTFQPYEIAPYAFGIISVEVPWKELKAWVR